MTTRQITDTKNGEKIWLGSIVVYRCKECSGVLSVSEFIERHCSSCGKDTDIVATKERVA